MYSVRVFDHELNVTHVIDDVISLELRRQPISAGQARIEVPIEDPAAQWLQDAANVSIWRGDSQVFSGRIVDREAGAVSLRADLMGQADRLRNLVTPHEWQGWNGFDLADFARDLLRRFRFHRWTTAEDWAQAVFSEDVNLTIEPGSVLLATELHEGGERFVSEGRIRLRLYMGPEAEMTGRVVRWSERAGDPVRITVRSRAANTESGLGNASWTPEATAVNVDSTRESEVVGAPIQDGGPWVEVEFALYTEDTESPDNAEAPQFYGRTPILDGVEVIWREPLGSIEPGDIPAETGWRIHDGKWDRVNHLKALVDECEAAGWRFRVRHDEAQRKLFLDLAPSWDVEGDDLPDPLGTDHSDEFALRHNDNAQISRIVGAGDEYANVLHCWGNGSGIDRIYVQLRNEQAIEERGEEVEADFEADADTAAELEEMGSKELAKRSSFEPRYEVEILDPALAHVMAGDRVKLVDPRLGTVFDVEATDEERRFGRRGEEVFLGLNGGSLASPIENIIRVQRSRPRGEIDSRPKPPRDVRARQLVDGVRLAWSGAAEAWEIWTAGEGSGMPQDSDWRFLARVVTPEFDHLGLALHEGRWYLIVSVAGERKSEPVIVFARAGRKIPEHGLDVLFGIKVDFNPEPVSGVAENLWDNNPSTGVVFNASAEIVFRYPMAQGTDLMRLHVDDEVGGYLQAWDENQETWENVIGSPGSPVEFKAGENVVPFDGQKMFWSRRFRLVLLQAATVRGLKFWRVLAADEILTHVLRLTGSMAIENEDGTLTITASKLEHRAPDNTLLFSLDGSDAFFGGTLRAGIIESEHIRVGDPVDRAVKKVNASRLPNALPEGGTLFHFDNSLQSTRGLRPLPGYVATLRPGEGRFGGAVAVEEARENVLFTLSGGYVSWLADLREGQSSDRSVGGGIVRVTRLGEHRFRAEVIQDITGTSSIPLTRTNFVWPANQPHVISAYIRDYYEAPGTNGAWGLGRTSSGGPNLNGRNGLGRKVHLYNPTSSDVTARFGLRAAGGNSLVTAGSYIEWEFAQAELNASFATSFVAGTRAAGRLEYPGVFQQGTISAWVYLDKEFLQSLPTTDSRCLLWGNATSGNTEGTAFLYYWRSGQNLRYRVVQADGTRSDIDAPVPETGWHHFVTIMHGDKMVLYIDGEKVNERNINVPMPSNNTLQVGSASTGGHGNFLIDELLILPYAASEDEIRAWYELQAPFYDTDSTDRVGVDMPDGHVITLDRRGMEMTPLGADNPRMRLTGYNLVFRDANEQLISAIGDVRDVAPEVGAGDMEAGLLLNLGEIRASGAVLSQSLASSSVTADKLPNEGILENKIKPGAIGITRLAEQIQVPDTKTLSLLRYDSGPLGGVREHSFAVPKRTANGHLMEALRCVVTVDATGITDLILRIDGDMVGDVRLTLGLQDITFIVDARDLEDGMHEFELSIASFSPYIHHVRLYQNEQLPIRWGAPVYSITESGESSGCYSNCQITCQESCQASCQSTCESTCQSGCQLACQSTCETTSQGGGGCIREGTPITIWDETSQAYRDVPVEQLQPGMILPGYNPEADTLEHGELIMLQDARFESRFLRIHTDNGPSVDVTYSQPFDVLADMGDGPRWYKLAAKFLRPGMQMVRPFEGPDKRLATITQVEVVLENQVHFWLPKTSHHRFTVSGYADAFDIK